MLNENLKLLRKKKCLSQEELAAQLARINEQLAIKNRRSRRIWKVVLGVVAAFAAIQIVFVILSVVSFGAYEERTHVGQLPISEENQTYE